MSKHIKTKEGLQELLKRYKEHNASNNWINVINYCIEQNVYLDNFDYRITPFRLRRLWKGLK